MESAADAAMKPKSSLKSSSKFESEITLLTVTQQNGPTLFCAPIGHRQERGDYMESWQPCAISDEQLHEAQRMAAAVTEALTGAGHLGRGVFLSKDGFTFPNCHRVRTTQAW
jgi:phosphoribosylglycinamide formyltransferase 2